jgi:hypothetical protein
MLKKFRYNVFTTQNQEKTAHEYTIVHEEFHENNMKENFMIQIAFPLVVCKVLLPFSLI